MSLTRSRSRVRSPPLILLRFSPSTSTTSRRALDATRQPVQHSQHLFNLENRVQSRQGRAVDQSKQPRTFDQNWPTLTHRENGVTNTPTQSISHNRDAIMMLNTPHTHRLRFEPKMGICGVRVMCACSGGVTAAQAMRSSLCAIHLYRLSRGITNALTRVPPMSRAPTSR